MPIYEYRCQNCQQEIEVIQKMADEALTKCDACGKDSLTKLISRSSFQLKGSGWYQTDFKNPPKTESATAATPAPAATAPAAPAATTTSTTSSSSSSSEAT